MKLKIVNEQEKNVVYIVTDTTEKYNLPSLSDTEILLVGDSPSKLIQYDREKLKKVLKENGFRYGIYIGRINLNDVIIESDMEEIEEEKSYECIEAMLDWLNESEVIKVGESEYDYCLSSYHDAVFQESIIDVDRSTSSMQRW